MRLKRPRSSRLVLARVIGLTVSIVSLPAVASGQTPIDDVFIGTLAMEKGEAILTRCDLASTRYVLRDAASSRAVAAYRKTGVPGYVEVMGSVDDASGDLVLTVSAFAEQVPGRSCHLLDVMDAATPSAIDARGTVPMASAEGASVRQDLAGHYYLSGVMETGSELLLRPDGRFEWMMSYGAADQAARGTWRVDGDTVTLSAKPDDDAPFATLRLRIADGALLPDGFGKGRYDRKP
jgi:hypothetical protein